MKRKMLVIPGAFVPYNDTVTLLTYKRLKHLDMDIDVLALKGKEDESLVHELSHDADFKKFNIIYSKKYEDTICINKPYMLPIGLVNMFIYYRQCLKQYKKENYEYIYTSSIPGISHIIGKAIKKYNPNVKWYASFSDPIKNAPYKKDPNLKTRSIFYRIAFHVGSFVFMNDKYEEAAINYADNLIFICPEQRDFTIYQYPNQTKLLKKSIVLPLSYIKDWDMYKRLLNAKEVHNNPKKVVHLGRLYGLRTITNFLVALKEVNEEVENLEEKIVFHQYSEIQKEDIKYIKDNNLEKVFVLHEKVSYDESLEIMESADALILFDTLMPNEKIQPYLPSKILEYLMLRKEILAVCGDNSPSYRILKEYGYSLLGSDKETIKENILRLIKSNGNYEFAIDDLESRKTCINIL